MLTAPSLLLANVLLHPPLKGVRKLRQDVHLIGGFRYDFEDHRRLSVSVSKVKIVAASGPLKRVTANKIQRKPLGRLYKMYNSFFNETKSVTPFANVLKLICTDAIRIFCKCG